MNFSPYKRFKSTTKQMYEDPNTIKGNETAPVMGFLKDREMSRGRLWKKMRNFLPNFPTMIRLILETKRSTNSLKKNPKNPKTKTSDSFIDELGYYAKELGVVIGFTKLRRELIFKNEAVLFDNAIVLCLEMDKEKISMAPSGPTEVMIMKSYNDLGIIAGKFATFLRKNGYGAQALHPLGGAVNYPPLVGDSGLGWYGKHGLAIIPEYGPRHRVTAVLTSIENLPVAEENQHKWIEEYCKTCGRCIEKCPVKAIFKEAIVNNDGTKTQIDDELCFEEFSSNYGCTVCVKECMFNRVGYDRLKENFLKKK